MIIPEHFGNANALGAAIAQISFEVDKVVGVKSDEDQESLKEEFRNSVRQNVIKIGAIADTVEVMSEITPFPYAEKAVRFSIKAIGDLDILKLEVQNEL